MKTMNSEDMKDVFYDRGGWKLKKLPNTVESGGDIVSLVLKLPLNIGKIYFRRVDEINVPRTNSNIWRFWQTNRAIVAVLNSDSLPRDLKDLLLAIDNYIKRRDVIDEALNEWLMCSKEEEDNDG